MFFIITNHLCSFVLLICLLIWIIFNNWWNSFIIVLIFQIQVYHVNTIFSKNKRSKEIALKRSSNLLLFCSHTRSTILLSLQRTMKHCIILRRFRNRKQNDKLLKFLKIMNNYICLISHFEVFSNWLTRVFIYRLQRVKQT